LRSRKQLASLAVQHQQLVDVLRGAATSERRLDALGVASDQLEVERGLS
jgi:hypothetical protein